jgi:uncharacterized protein YbjT (DUF2867 family)
MTDLIRADVTAGGDMFLVTGGTGTLGRLVVPQLVQAGGKVRVLSRHPRSADEGAAEGIEFMVGDLDTGQGIDAAVAGADVIVHCAGGRKGDGDKARTLVRAASRAGGLAGAGPPHLVNISVTGADRVPQDGRLDRAMFGYFGMKLDAEQVIAGSGLPWTTLRATQFYDLLLMVARAMARLPVIPAPSGMRFQPVDAGEVAARLAELALGSPSGLVPDLAGPRIYPLADLVRGYLRAAGKRRRIVPVPLPGRAAQAVRDGANLAPERAVGRRTWEEFLAERVGR